MHQGLPWAGAMSAESVSGGSRASSYKGSPPHTPRTRDRRWSRSPPTRSLHACDDDATLSILATTTLK